jgi:hypothetical protein
MNDVNDVVLDKDALKEQYQKAKFSPDVINGLLQAHERVLQLGKLTSWEWVVSVDCVTGKFVGEPYTEKKDTVSWKHDGRIAGVHNHLDNTPFSEADVYAFAQNKEACALGIQGHDGSFYVLTRHTKDSMELTENYIQERFDDAVLSKYFKAFSPSQRCEIAAKSIAADMGWGFLKGGGCNGKN